MQAKSRFKLSHAIVVALAITSSATPSFALGTEEQRAACTPDVFRLCSAEIPNVDKIVACLKREKPHLSVACRAVFNGPDRTQHATRSMAAAENEAPGWCDFRSGAVDEQQQTWLGWCGAGAHKQ